jgi:hypothetical protein
MKVLMMKEKIKKMMLKKRNRMMKKANQMKRMKLERENIRNGIQSFK